MNTYEMIKNVVYRKKISESKTRMYYVTTNGKFYYIDKSTNKRHYIIPHMVQGNLYVSIGNGIHGIARNFMAKAWFKDCPKCANVIHKNGDIYDFRIENLEIVSRKELLKNKKEK